MYSVRRYLGYVILAFCVFLFVSTVGCHKAPKCWGKTISNAGLIAFDTTVCDNCTMIADQEEQFVITNQSAYNKLMYYLYGNNGVCALNAIDFSRYSLLGINTFLTCKYKVERNVFLNESEKKYIYSIEINECGNCSEQSYVQHWVLIPKIKTGYDVDFILTRY
jgi:hypothetical protein